MTNCAKNQCTLQKCLCLKRRDYKTCRDRNRLGLEDCLTQGGGWDRVPKFQVLLSVTSSALHIGLQPRIQYRVALPTGITPYLPLPLPPCLPKEQGTGLTRPIGCFSFLVVPLSWIKERRLEYLRMSNEMELGLLENPFWICHKCLFP